MRFILAVCLFLACATSHAEFMSGRALLSLLNAQDPASQQGAAGYVAGVVDLATSDPAHEQSVFCFAVPREMSLTGLVNVVHVYLQREAQGAERAGLDEFTASGLVRVALAAKFPCAQQT